MAAKTDKRDFICNYRQQGARKSGKSASEHQHGKRKRWYEQYYRQDDPQGAGLPKNKLGWAVQKVRKGKPSQCRTARPGECPDVRG